MIIKCLDDNMPAHDRNARYYECEAWLSEHAGEKWQTYQWQNVYGYVDIFDSEVATVFKLKFGL